MKNMENAFNFREKVRLTLKRSYPDPAGDVTAWLNATPLDPAPSLKVRNHSPGGFNYGYHGSGPAQLALAICLELYGERLASRVYQDFKRKFIAVLPMNEDFDGDLDLIDFNLDVMNVAKTLSDDYEN